MATLHQIQHDLRMNGVLFVEDFDAVAGVTVLDDAEQGTDIGMDIGVPTPATPDIEAIREAAFAEGRRVTLDDAQLRQTEASSAAIEILSARIAAATEEARTIAADSAAAIARTILAMFAAVLPECCARHGPREVAAVAASILPALAYVPQVTIRAHPSAGGALAATLDALDPDLRTRIQVLPTDAVAAGDVRIAWQDGHATRDTASLCRIVATTLASLGLAGPAPTPAPAAQRRDDEASAQRPVHVCVQDEMLAEA